MVRHLGLGGRVFRSLPVITLLVSASLVAPGVASATGPALNGWSVGRIIQPDGQDVSADFGVTGPTSGVIVYRSSRTTFVRTTANSGGTWSARSQISPSGRTIAEVHASVYGRDVDVLQRANGGTLLRHSGDGGTTWDPTRSLAFDMANPRIARGPGGLLAVIGFDQSGPRWRVRVSQNGGATWGPVATVGQWAFTGGDAPPTAIGISGTSIVVVFTDQHQRLVSRRSTNGGQTWSSPRTIGSTNDFWVASIAVSGASVVVAYDQEDHLSERLTVRRSTDRGASWSPPVPFGIGVTGAEVGYGQGSWHLVSSDETGTWRDRSSTDGLSWSAATVIDTGHDYLAPPIGVGGFSAGPAAAFLDAAGLGDDIWFARD